MNKIGNRFLLTGDNFMPEMLLKQPEFTYSASGAFTKNKERNDLDKAFFQHDMAYGKCKDLTKRTESERVLRDKAFKIASNPKYDRYQRGLASMAYTFFNKKSKDSGVTSDPHRLLLNLTDKVNLKGSNKYVIVSTLNIYYTWKNIKKSYKNNELKMSAPTWNEEFELPGGSYSVSDIEDHFEYILKNMEKRLVILQ